MILHQKQQSKHINYRELYLLYWYKVTDAVGGFAVILHQKQQNKHINYRELAEKMFAIFDQVFATRFTRFTGTKVEILTQLCVCGSNWTAAALFLLFSLPSILVQSSNTDAAVFAQDGSGSVQAEEVLEQMKKMGKNWDTEGIAFFLSQIDQVYLLY